MKKILIALLLLIAVKVYSQSESVVLIDSMTFISGGGTTADSLRFYDLQGLYSHVWMAVKDTGSTYTDSVIILNIIKTGFYSTDSSVSPQQLFYAGSYYGASSVANTTTTYLVFNNAMTHIQVYLANAQFINGRRVKVKLYGVLRNGSGGGQGSLYKQSMYY